MNESVAGMQYKSPCNKVRKKMRTPMHGPLKQLSANGSSLT